MAKLIINCDGGSRGNPGPAACACVVTTPEGETVYEQSKYLNITTNNQAEYSGVLLALEWLISNPDFSELEFRLDSQLVVQQINGVYKVKDENIRRIFDQVKLKLKEAGNKKIVFMYVPRAQNSRADFLVNECLDASHK